MAETKASVQAEAVAPTVDEAELMRARLYALLGRLLVAPPEAQFLRQIGLLVGDEAPLGRSLDALSAAARATDPRRAEREYHRLFIGVGRGELLPFGSYYMTGFLHEKPLARLRGDMAALGIARAEGVSEPEDHVGSLCEIMAGLIGGGFAVDVAAQQRFFDRHLAPWAGRFFDDLSRADAPFYRTVGGVGSAFMDIERAAFELAA